MNRIGAIALTLIITLCSLSGCFGGDEEVDAEPPQTQGTELSDWNVHFAGTAADLPTCDAATNGRLYYVEDVNEFQVCKTTGWETIAIQGADGMVGADGLDGSSTIIMVAGSTLCQNGGNRFNIGLDQDGSGTLDTLEIATNVEICHGEDGSDGAPGQEGPTGPDGLQSLVVTNPFSVGANCGNGGVMIESGVDLNNDSILDSNEVDSTQYVCNGANTNPFSATNKLTSAGPADASFGCKAGGMVVMYGLDNGDGTGVAANGILEDGEIDQSMTVCSTWSFSLVKDINPSGDGYPLYIIEFGDMLYFSANDGVHGYELWYSDGTPEGTSMLLDINSGSASSLPKYFVELNGSLIFSADDGVDGVELWRTDGTVAGTYQLEDIYPGSDSGHPNEMTYFDGAVWFMANDGDYGYELWTSNGNVDGTYLVKDIFIFDDNSSYPSNFVVYDEKLYFTAYSNDFESLTTIGREIWSTDGTSAGTNLLTNLNGLDDGVDTSGPLVVFNDELYFMGNNGSYGWELWSTNGTEEGTSMFLDIHVGSGDDSSWPGSFLEFEGMLYFEADNYDNGSELWVTDGTPTNTSLLIDLKAGFYGSSPQFLTIFGNHFYFVAYDSSWNFYESDGTSAGTQLLPGLEPPNTAHSPSFVEYKGEMYFTNVDTVNGGVELWKMHTTTSITHNTPYVSPN